MGTGVARLQVVALGLGAALLAPLAIINAVAPLYTLVALLAVAALIAGRGWRGVPRVPLLLALALLGWAALSILWAVDPARSARGWASLALSLAGGLALFAAADALSSDGRARVGRALALGTIAALVPLTIEAIARARGWTPTPQQWLLESAGFAYGPHQLNRVAALVAIAVWPAAAILARHAGWRRAWLLPAWAACVLPAFDSAAALLALVCAAATLVLAVAIDAWRPRALRILAPAAIAIGVAAMPMLPNWEPFRARFTERAQGVSIWHRAEIWSFVATRIAERPLLGWGLDSARSMPGGKDLIDGRAERLPLHPHNNILQLWLELGLPGAALMAILASAVARRACAQADRAGRLALLAALAAALAVAATGYGVWQAWWMGALWIVASAVRAAFGGVAPGPASHDRTERA